MTEVTNGVEIVLCDVREENVSVDEVLAAVRHPQCGGIALFVGVVRDHDHGEAVTALDYEAHPDAERFLRETCAEVARETGLRVAAAHRIGELVVGEVALVASVAAAHRAPAFAACALLVDRIKERTPIWKRQHLDGGTTEWVNL